MKKLLVILFILSGYLSYGQLVTKKGKVIDSFPTKPTNWVTQYQLTKTTNQILNIVNTPQSPGTSGWGLSGTAGTNPTSNFIGTTDNQEFVIKANSSEAGRFGTYGNFSFGQDASSTGYQSIAMGSVGTRAFSNYSNVIGTGAISLGDVSTVIGNGLTGRNYGSTTLGNWNDTATNISSLFFADDSTNDLFAIGNGRANNARHNAVTILQSGKVGINVRHPTAKLHVSGDIILDIPGKGDGYVLVGNINGYAIWKSPSAIFKASTTSGALFNLPVGVAPTSPGDGDVWREDNTNTGLKIRINGVTKTISVL